MRMKAQWAIDSEAIRARGIILIYRFSKIQLVGQKKFETKHLLLVKARKNAIQLPFFWFSKPMLSTTSGL